VYPSPLRRSLAAAASLFTLAALAVPAGAAEYRASAATTITDPTGDVTADDAAATPVNEPRADVTAASAEYRTNEIALTVNVVAPTDPRTDPNWKNGASSAIWGLDTTGDNNTDFLVSMVNAGGYMTAGVVRLDDPTTVLCLGAATFDGATYAATIDPACVGNPASFKWGGGMVYDTKPADPKSPLAGDGAPDGDAMAGPLLAPAPLAPSAGGYWLVGDDGGIFSYNAPFLGSTGAIKLNQPIVAMAADPDGKGYWFVASDGGIFAYDAPFFGSTGAIKLNKPIVGMTPTPTGKGYWLVASDGGIFSFGDAAFFGSTGAITLNKPIVGIASSGTGKGYWLVASDGGIFAFGDGGFFGSAGALKLTQPIVGMASSGTGKGYWFVASDGGIFAFGDARFFGSAIGSSFPVVGIAAAHDGKGYSIVRADGSVANRGSAPSAGSLAGHHLSRPIVGIAATG
jgi:ribosomal protein L24E